MMIVVDRMTGPFNYIYIQTTENIEIKTRIIICLSESFHQVLWFYDSKYCRGDCRKILIGNTYI